MAIRTIRKEKDPCLYKKCREVTNFDERLLVWGTFFAEGLHFLLVIPVLAAIMIWYRRGGRLSRAAWLAIAPWFLLQTLGAHYTFEHVPFGWVTEFFGFQRNHFDRICHFCVGGFAFPALELLERRGAIRGRGLAVFCVVMGIFGFAAIFEIFEWLYAVSVSPEAGAAFLGSQGDIWDAQRDMLADGLGAICASLLYCLLDPLRCGRAADPARGA